MLLLLSSLLSLLLLAAETVRIEGGTHRYTYAISIRGKKSTTWMRDKKLLKPPNTSFSMLCVHEMWWASMCCIRSSRPLTNIRPKHEHTKKCVRVFSHLRFIYSSLHGEMNRDRCRWQQKKRRCNPIL